MKITVCIPTFNQAQFLRLAVESVLAQRGCEVEVWVSDDASTDSTPQVMEVFADDPRVRYHRQPQNKGIAANAAWVIGQAETDYFVRLDSDDLLAPDYCVRLAEMLQANPSAGVAHAAVQEIDQAGEPRRVRLLRRSTGHQDAETALREGATGYRVAANICMFRRKALPPTPCFRPGMNFCEDWDLFIRMADAGWGNIYCDQVLASYRVWTDSGGYRQGRKVVEVVGIRQVFDASLEPAFRIRGWDLSPLTLSRRRIACGQVRALRLVPKGSKDYVRITQELIGLGDGFGLRLRLGLVHLGLGLWLDLSAWFRLKIRDMAKSVLTRIPVGD